MSYIGKQPRKAALTASDIEDGIITAAKIEDGAVVAAEIASNAVTTAKINADAVTAAKIADDAVGTDQIAGDAAISTSGAITTTGAFTSIGIDDNSDAVAMTITDAEKIGIGETAPLGKLHVKSGDSGVSSPDITDLVVECSGSGGMSLLGATNGQVEIAFGDSGDANIGRFAYNNNENFLATVVNASEVIRTHSNGVTSFNNGIALGVGAGNNTASNVLGDYEEGTWSPTYSDGSNTSNATVGLVGNYTKIGQFVSVCGRIYQNNSDNNGLTDGNALSIGNLPFTSTSHSNFSTSGSVSTRGSDSSVTLPTQRPTRLQLLDNTNLAQVHYDAGGTKGAISMLCSMIKMSGYNSWMYFQISYETDA